MVSMGVVAVIVSHDPELDRFRLVLDRVSGQVGRVIIVDNDSRSKGVVSNCDFVEVGFNSGVAHALRVGVNYASKYKPDWLLFLDDDTILMNNAIKTALNLTALRPIKSRIGSINLGSENGSCSVEETRYVMFSGLLIRFNIASKVCCRDDFFLD